MSEERTDDGWESRVWYIDRGCGSPPPLGPLLTGWRRFGAVVFLVSFLVLAVVAFLMTSTRLT